MTPIPTDTLSGRCAQYLLDNSMTCVTEHGVMIVMPVNAATLCELIDFVEKESGSPCA